MTAATVSYQDVLLALEALLEADDARPYRTDAALDVLASAARAGTFQAAIATIANA